METTKMTMVDFVKGFNDVTSIENYPALKEFKGIFNTKMKELKELFETKTKSDKEMSQVLLDKAGREYIKTCQVFKPAKEGEKEISGSIITYTKKDDDTVFKMELKEVKDNNITGFVVDEDGERVTDDNNKFVTTWRRYYQINIPSEFIEKAKEEEV